jgi:hypothetical protein
MPAGSYPLCPAGAGRGRGRVRSVADHRPDIRGRGGPTAGHCTAYPTTVASVPRLCACRPAPLSPGEPLRVRNIMAEALGRAKRRKVHVARSPVRTSGEPLWTAERYLGPSNARNEPRTGSGARGNR